ncbi:MAG: DUF5686 family protein [Bacteroidia bacterium]
MGRTSYLWLCILLLPQSLLAQELRGRILNHKQEPLAFASIVLMPGNHSTISSDKGRYEISLEPGTYQVQIHFLGYNALRTEVTVSAAGLQRDFVLSPQVFELAEIRIRAKGEDPAYAIMRRAIRNAPLHLAAVDAYTAKTYVKGSFRITKAPWAIRKILDTENLQVGTTYLLESVSEVNFSQPANFSEKVISLRSNLPPGSNPTINFANFNFYRPAVGEIISPLSPRAFRNYRFVYRGEKNEGGQQLIRIGLEPRSKGPYLLSGDIYLLEPQLSIHSMDVGFTDDNGIRYQLQQQYQRFDRLWMPVKQDVRLDLKYLGAHAELRYVTSVRSYKIERNAEALHLLEKPLAAPIESGRAGNIQARKQAETHREATKIELPKEEPAFEYNFSVDTMARRQPDEVWKSLRQMPLEEEELLGYKQADSLYIARELKADDDSLRKDTFKWHHPISGGSYRLGPFIEGVGYSKQLKYQGLLSGIVPRADFYNVVEGFVLSSELNLLQRESRLRRSSLGLNMRYATARDRFLAHLHYSRKHDMSEWHWAAGTGISQINTENPISPGVNFLQTVLFNDNIMRLYERAFVSGGFRKQLNRSVVLGADAQFARRIPLENAAQLWPWPTNDRFRPNNPVNLEMPNTRFEAHNFAELQLELQWQPWANWVRINGEDRISNSNRPYFTLRSLSGFSPNYFQTVEVGLVHYKSLRKGNSLVYQVDMGTFVRQPTYFLDFKHFNGFQSFLQSNQNQQFRNLPFYRFSTAGPYLTAFSSIRLGRLALSRIDRVRLFGVDEALFASALITREVQHVEAGYNISGPFRLVGVDFFASINNLEPIKGGLRFRLGL